MSALVIVEHTNQHMQVNTANSIAAALQISPEPVFLVVGYECQAVAEQVAALKGVSRVLVADAPCYQYQLAENMSELIVSLADSYRYIIAPASTFGKNLLPRVAASLDVGQISDVSRIIDSQTFEHPIYAGNAIETVKMNDDKKLLTIRSTAFPAMQEKQACCPIEKLDVVFNNPYTLFVKQELSQSARPELANAKIVVSGGRGLQSAEKFQLIEQLADALGAAVGASRAAVDAGFAPNDYQVGQTGKVVAPHLYIAVGISGAVQHIAGIKDAKVIVAINKDKEAPIFQVADYGLVGDLFELVPQIIEQLKKMKN